MLAYTNLELLEVSSLSDNHTEFILRGFGKGILRFERVRRGMIRVLDKAGGEVPYDFYGTAAGGSFLVKTVGQEIRVLIDTSPK